MTTETFYVSSDKNIIRKATLPSGEYLGKAKYFIEVFGNNHHETAKKVKKMVQDAGMENSIFRIKVDTK